MCLFQWTVYSRGEAIDWKSAEEGSRGRTGGGDLWAGLEEWPGGEESQGTVRGEIFLDFHVFPSPFYPWTSHRAHPPRRFLGHWWNLSELERCLTLDIICWWIGELAPVFWERSGNAGNTQIMSVRWHWSCHFHSWVGTGFDQVLLANLLAYSPVWPVLFKQLSCVTTQIYEIIFKWMVIHCEVALKSKFAEYFCLVGLWAVKSLGKPRSWPLRISNVEEQRDSLIHVNTYNLAREVWNSE